MIEYTEATYTQRIHSEERIIGKRAKFHIFHVSNKGKKRFDISWADTPEQAAAEMVANYKMVMRTQITVLGFARCDQSISI